MVTHAGMTADDFDGQVRAWIASARCISLPAAPHGLACQPMLELLDYLRANDFKTFIVSGCGAEFMRVFAERLYGIPPEQVIGTLLKTKFELRAGKPVMAILPEIAHWDEREGKPAAIQQIFGRRPIGAFGNSDGDLQMLLFTTIGRAPSVGLVVHHTDTDWEWVYDKAPKSSGKLVDALVEAGRLGWTVVDMKADWKRVFAFEP